MSGSRAMLGSTNPEIYKHSGKVPPSGLMLAAVILIPAAIILGILYSAAVVYIPFIKLRGIATFFYGGALGALSGTVCYQAKFRSHFFVLLTTLGVTLLSYYVSWGIHPAMLAMWNGENMDDVISVAIMGLRPDFVIGWARFIFDNGLWGMNANNAISGWAVVALWAVEALIIFGVALAAKMTYGNAPFCEDCNEWTEETKELANLPVSPEDPAWQQFAGGNLDAVKKLQISQETPQYVELQLAACPSCTNSDFISAVGVTLSVNNDGDLQKQENDIVRHLHISHQQKDEMVEFAAAMNQAVAEMEDDEDDPDAVSPAVESTPEDPA